MLSGFLAHLFYHPNALETPAYKIGAAEISSSAPKVAATPTGPQPISSLLVNANAAEGQKIANKCKACHSFNKGGSNKLGPNLWNVVGGKPASVGNYKYSSAMKKMSVAWGYEELNQFLYKPKAYLKGTKMSFAGLKKAKDRASLIAYLRSLSDNPKPMP